MEKSGDWITRVDLRGLSGSDIRGSRTHATGYLSWNIDLTFVVLFYLCVLVVIFILLYYDVRNFCNLIGLVFQLNLKYLHVRITNLLWVVV